MDAFPQAPRGSSRRYFRGNQGLTMIERMRPRFKTSKEFFDANYVSDYKGLVERMSGVPGFGEYFIWKMADLYDRVLGRPVLIDDWAIGRLPNHPRKGAKLVAEELGVDWKFDDIVKHMVAECQSSGFKALPNNDRLVDVSEVETFLCGISHHYHSRDYVGKDLVKAAEPLVGAGGECAQVLRECLPPTVSKDWFQEPGAPTKG